MIYFDNLLKENFNLRTVLNSNIIITLFYRYINNTYTTCSKSRIIFLSIMLEIVLKRRLNYVIKL